MKSPEGVSGDIAGRSRGVVGVPSQLLEAPDVWNQAVLRLSADDIAELVGTNGECVQRVPMYEFSSFDEFLNGQVNQNNFRLAFTASGIGELYREHKHFQRFAILYPDLYVSLLRGDADMRAGRARGEEARYGDVWWRDLYEAYQRVSELVDARDDVTRTDSGQVSPYLLIGYRE